MNTTQLSDTVRSTFNFSIDKLPLAGPDNMRTPWYGLFRSDNGETVGIGSVTKVYEPHTTDDVIALTEAAASAFDDNININCYFNNGHYVFCQPSRDYRRRVFGERDNVWPRVIIRAGYDMKSFNATLGYYRDACRNLSILRQVSGTSVAIRHTSKLRMHMDDLINTFDGLRNKWVTLGETIEHLQDRHVSLTAFLDGIYGQPDPDSQRSKTVHKNRTEAIFKRVLRERLLTGRQSFSGSDFTVSAWEAYNAVQGFVQHDATRQNRNEYARILQAFNDKSVRKAEELAFAAA